MLKGEQLGMAIRNSLCSGSEAEKSPLAVTLLQRSWVRFCLVKSLPNKEMEREPDRDREILTPVPAELELH